MDETKIKEDDMEYLGFGESEKIMVEEINDLKIDKKLKEAMELCKTEGITGKNTLIGGYYVQFKFEKSKQKCEKCGQVIE